MKVVMFDKELMQNVEYRMIEDVQITRNMIILRKDGGYREFLQEDCKLNRVIEE